MSGYEVFRSLANNERKLEQLVAPRMLVENFKVIGK